MQPFCIEHQNEWTLYTSKNYKNGALTLKIHRWANAAKN